MLLVAATTMAVAAPVNQLARREKAAGWRLLFDGKTTHGWRSFKKPSFPDQGWRVEDGWLHCLGKGGGDIITDAQFDDFELQWEWKLAAGANSGVKYFVLESRNEVLGHEYQMIDDARPSGVDRNCKQLTAAFYAVLELVRRRSSWLAKPILHGSRSGQPRRALAQRGQGAGIRMWGRRSEKLSRRASSRIRPALATRCEGTCCSRIITARSGIGT